MAFHTRMYDVYLVLTGASAPVPWSTGSWLPVAQALAPFAVSERGKAAVRCTQIDKATRKRASFGRLGWNEASHRKWTHDMPQEAPWTFLGAEAWAPSWTQCEKDGLAPDCFVALSTPSALMRESPLQFGGKLLVALTCDAPQESRDQLRDAIAGVAQSLDSPLTVHQSRAWGKASYGGFTAAMNDLSVASLFHNGSPHERPLDLSTFEESWSPVYP
ncbi:hypothetical protein [Achromobacter sp.]|uniref:hypothetical protein n=1 Tax=Achromobacter sp. TaxID=134375 RepID=UPI0028A776FA|nr:hypothetical protein [Achromobacter sp.]